METKNNINGKSAAGKKDNDKLNKGIAATGIGLGSAAMGFGGAAAFAAMNEEPELEDEITEEDIVEAAEPVVEAPHHAAAASVQPHVAQAETVDIPDEPDGPDVVETPGSVENVDPNLIADAIIAEEEVDTEDIEEASPVEFSEVGEVYTVDGSSYTGASFSIGADTAAMIDIDGDNVFDVVVDDNGALLTDTDGLPLSANGMTVGDAQLATAEEGTYIAADDTTPTGEDFGTDVIDEDMIS